MSDQGNALQARYLQDLSRDRHFAALPPDRQAACLETCLAYAARQAAALRAALPGPPDGEALREWAAAQGVTVAERQTKYDLPYLAEYVAGQRQIDLYTRRIDEAQQALAAQYPERFAAHSLQTMCLAHELFHLLESRDNGAPGRLLRLPVRRLGLVPGLHDVPQASEIAAHAFVADLLDLDFSTYTFFDELAALYRPAQKGEPHE